MSATATTARPLDPNGNPIAFGLTVPTPNPCPAWCTENRGHGYDSVNDWGCPTRWHGAVQGHFLTESLDQHGHPSEFTVDVVELEAAHPGTGSVLGTDLAELRVTAESTALTVAEARALAAALSAAADLLEDLQRRECE